MHLAVSYCLFVCLADESRSVPPQEALRLMLTFIAVTYPNILSTGESYSRGSGLFSGLSPFDTY